MASLADVGVHRLSTSLRTRSLADTLTIATALMPQLGIADCTDATADDLLGVPVWFSFRPGNPANPVRAGKGMRPLEAQVGALMEAIEHAVAERADAMPPGRQRPLSELLAPFGGSVTAADLAPRFGAALSPDCRLPVDACEDITTGEQHWMPSELLRLSLPLSDAGGPLFGCSSNGLASGNSLDEATLHALLEVLERDTLALDHVRPSCRFVAPASLPAPFADWQARWQTLGVRLSVRELDNAFGLTCLEAELAPMSPEGPGRSKGYGMHPDTSVALTRAVTEAAQSRLHALRFGRTGPQRPPKAATGATDGTAASRHERPFAELPSQTCGSVEDTLTSLLALLRARGLPWVLRRRLNADPDAADLLGLHVVKLLVPGCETPVGSPMRIGRRLAQRLLQAH